MGNFSFNYKPILSYYIFQKKIKNQLNNKRNQKEVYEMQKGYFISPEWIKEWKKRINYKSIEKMLDKENIKSSALNDEQKIRIKNYFNKLNQKCEINNIVKKDNIYINDFSSELYLQFFVDNETYNKMEIKKTSKKQVKYILKKQMIIFFFKKEKIIKIIIHCLYPFSIENKLINLTFYFGKNEDNYNTYKEFFQGKKSDEILELLIGKNILIERIIKIKMNNSNYYIYNEDLNKEYKDKMILENKNKNSEEDLGGIKNPKNIDFGLIYITSERGLDNVGATCYMNATLQCLANIKPITDYLLNKEHYSYLFKNFDLCILTLQYIQVLIGLFCNESQKGSYSPEEFKKTISELNPLFQGVQANDSKDLVIFLLEAMNNELVKIHNKKKNIIEKENEAYQIIDSSDEKKVLEYFIHNFKKTHCSIIGDYLCGFNKSVFICQNCSKITFNFNIFNLLIFSLEATSNYFNLSYNNSVIPTINFDYCFKYMSKEEQFQDTYCQKCGTIGLAKYRETIYSLPLYLIIILNRGRGNIFNCNVQIPQIFDASNYIEIKSKNNSYELVGIVSHFGESGMGGHFIAFCKHSIDGKWRCYNDSIVTECQNDYLNKGTPYIVFYKKCDFGKSNMQKNNPQMKKSKTFSDQNMNLNFNNNNMGINNNFNNNNNINQSMNMNMININNNFFQQNMMMMNNNNNNHNMAMNINNCQNINANNNLIQQNKMMMNNNNNNYNMAMNINNCQNINTNNNLIQQNKMMMNNFNNFNQNAPMNMNNRNYCNNLNQMGLKTK